MLEQALPSLGFAAEWGLVVFVTRTGNIGSTADTMSRTV